MSVGHGGLYHSQSPEGYFMGASGLKVCIFVIFSLFFNVYSKYHLLPSLLNRTHV